MQENGRESKRLEENRREWKRMQYGSVGSVLLSLCSMADFTGKWRKRYKTKILSNGNPAQIPKTKNHLKYKKEI